MLIPIPKAADVSLPSCWRPIAIWQTQNLINFFHQRFEECLQVVNLTINLGSDLARPLNTHWLFLNPWPGNRWNLGSGYGWRVWIYGGHLTKLHFAVLLAATNAFSRCGHCQRWTYWCDERRHKYPARKHCGDLTKRRHICFRHGVRLARLNSTISVKNWQTNTFPSTCTCICLTQLWPLLFCSVWGPRRWQHLTWTNWMQYNVTWFVICLDGSVYDMNLGRNTMIHINDRAQSVLHYPDVDNPKAPCTKYFPLRRSWVAAVKQHD